MPNHEGHEGHEEGIAISSMPRGGDSFISFMFFMVKTR